MKIKESDLKKIVRECVLKTINEDASDRFFNWMDDKEYSNDERGDLEQELDYRDSMNDYNKDRQMQSDWNDLDNELNPDRFHADYDNDASNRSNLNFRNGLLGMAAQSDNDEVRNDAQSDFWQSKTGLNEEKMSLSDMTTIYNGALQYIWKSVIELVKQKNGGKATKNEVQYYYSKILSKFRNV